MEKNILNGIKIDQEIRVAYDYRIYSLSEYALEFLKERNFEKIKQKEQAEQFIDRIVKNFNYDWEKRGGEENESFLFNRKYTNMAMKFFGLQWPKVFDKSDEELTPEEEEESDTWLNYIMPKLLKESALKNLEILAPSNIHEIPKKRYSADNYPNIYTELAKLEPFNHKEIISFASIFGLPSKCISLYDFSYIEWFGYHLNFLCFFYFDLITYKRKFNVFLDLLSNTPPKDNMSLFGINVDHNPAISLSLNKSNEIVPRIEADSLFDIAYFQMMRALTNNAKMKKCEFCGHEFEVTHEKQRFCPPLPNRKRSSCEMAYNNRMRKARKLYEAGKTLDEIDGLVDLPISDIKNYIESHKT
jgi:hypothetical protein